MIDTLQAHFKGSAPLQPIAIYYCSQILKNASYRGQKAATENRSEDKFTKDCRDNGHVSTVIGRRWDHGKRQFLIRNSWGTECEVYDDAWPCDQNKYKGGVWVDAERPAPNVYGTQAIE